MVDSQTFQDAIVRELVRLLDDETRGMKARNPELRDAVYAAIRKQPWDKPQPMTDREKEVFKAGLLKSMKA